MQKGRREQEWFQLAVEGNTELAAAELGDNPLTVGLMEDFCSDMHRAFVEGWLFRGGRHRRRCRLRRYNIGGRDSGIRQKGIRRREFARFIAAVEKLPNEVTEFEESMWSDLVESMTVYAKDDIRFILPCQTEIKA